MFLVGLTGGIGTGKSTVVKILKEFDVDVVDADIIARQIVEPGMKAHRRIREEFGDEVFQQNGQIDRAKLANIIFNDQEKRKLLDGITHPEIYKQIFWQCFWAILKGTQFVVLDLPLLFESGYMLKFLHKIIVVKCDNQQQIDRLINRNNYSIEEAQTRINAQMSIQLKCQLADYVIDNNKSLDDTKNQVKRIVLELRKSKAHWKTRIILGTSLLTVFSASIYAIYKLF